MYLQQINSASINYPVSKPTSRIFKSSESQKYPMAVLKNNLVRYLNDCLIELKKTEFGPIERSKLLEFVSTDIDKKEISHYPLWNNNRRDLLPEPILKLSLNLISTLAIHKLPSEGDLKIFMECLEKSILSENNQRTISYEEFMSLRKKIPRSVFNLLMPATFFRAHSVDLPQQINPRIPIDLIMEFITLKTAFNRNRFIMARYDLNGTGTLDREHFLLYYRKEVMPLVDILKDLEETFEICYLNTVESMFFFFLDPKHTGRIRMTDALICGFLENAFGLQTNNEDYENWFSPEKTHQLNATFQMYDLKQKNYLDKDDLKRIQNDSNGFTPTFINRLFETHVTNDGEKMSYEEFVIFQIAYNHLAHPASIAYFFKILDVDGDGFLTRYEFHYFYTELRLAYNGWYMDGAMPEFDDFVDQFFDIVKPVVNGRITLQELLACKQGHNFILCLISYTEFYKYEIRESENGNALDQDSEMPLFSEDEFNEEMEEKPV